MRTTRRAALAGLASMLALRPASAGDKVSEQPIWPWQGATFIRGNLAAGSLRETILRRLKNEHGVHSETLASAIGALAGFAALNSALIKAAEMTKTYGHVPKMSDLYVAQTKDAKRFFLGNLINDQVLGGGGERFYLLAFLAKGYSSKGMDDTVVAEVTRLIKQTSSLLGSTDFGKSHALEKHKPGFAPADLLKALWPTAVEIFKNPLPAKVREEPELDERHWGPIIHFVAAQYMEITKQSLDSKVYFSLAIEAAIICSKFDPDNIDPGKWKSRLKLAN